MIYVEVKKQTPSFKHMTGFIFVVLLNFVSGVVLLPIGAITPEFVAALATLSPWAAENAVQIGYAAFVLIMLATAFTPHVLMNLEMREYQREYGNHAGEVQKYEHPMLFELAVLFAAIPAVFYMVAVCWFAMK